LKARTSTELATKNKGKAPKDCNFETDQKENKFVSGEPVPKSKQYSPVSPNRKLTYIKEKERSKVESTKKIIVQGQG